MKTGLLVVSPNEFGLSNIGDYIQAHAASQFFDKIDTYIDRDWGLKACTEGKIKMIMNGWYMDHPENFPPSEDIVPLFVSMHINKYSLPGMLRDECIEYFKKHEPIGCRDENTVALLNNKGIKAYFTGCLTLTLGRKFKFLGERNGIYIVDAYFSTMNISKRPVFLLRSMFSLITNYRSIKSIAQKKKDTSLKSLIHNAVFFSSYKKVFDKDILQNAQYICQYDKSIGLMSTVEKLDYAEQLLKMYASAECVITSRIHCALPCLGLETPVLFINDDSAEEMSVMRFGGIMPLLNSITWKDDKLIWSKDKITRSNFPKNKDGWRDLAVNLIQKCEEFVSK